MTLRLTPAILLIVASTACNGGGLLPHMQITPDDPRTADDLVIILDEPSVTLSSDEDDSHTLQWFRDEQQVESLTNKRTVPAADTAKGQTWRAKVMETRLVGAKNEVSGSLEVTIGNTAPDVSSLSIGPNPAFTTDTITADFVIGDADGDPVTATRVWRVNGTMLGVSGNALASSGFVKGDVVELEVTPNDGETDGTPMTEAITIQNTPPELASAAITPGGRVTVESVLTCEASGWVDADDDAESVSFVWEKNGVEVATATTFAVEGSAEGDRIRCGAIPDDGEDVGDPVYSAAVSVEGTATSDCEVPTLPADPYIGDALEPARVQPSGGFAVDSALNVARDWCAEGVQYRPHIDLLIQSDRFATTGDFAEACSVRLTPIAETVELIEHAYEAVDAGGRPQSLLAQGFLLQPGEFTVEDYPIDVDGSIVGGCLSRTYDATRWGTDLKKSISDMPWGLYVGDMESQIKGFMEDASSDDPDDDKDLYSLHADGFVMGAANVATEEELSNPYLIATAFEIDETTGIATLDSDDEPIYVHKDDAAPVGKNLGQAAFSVIALGYWNAEYLFEI